MKKLFIKIIALFFITVIGVAVILPQFYKDDIEAIIIKEIELNINQQVYFTGLRVSLFWDFPNLSISLIDCGIVGIDEFAGDTLISLHKLRVVLDLGSLIFDNKIDLKNIYLEKPYVRLIVLENGKSNYETLIPDRDTVDEEAADSSLINFEIELWEIKNGRINYENHQKDTYIEINGLNQKGKGDFTSDIFDLVTNTQISEATVVINNKNYLNKGKLKLDLILNVNLAENRYIFKKNVCEINHFKFSCEGFFKTTEQGYQTDIHFEAKENEFKNILSLIPGMYNNELDRMKTKGNFDLEGTIKGIYDTASKQIPAFNLEMKISDAMFQYHELPVAVENIRFHFIVSNKGGKIENTVLDIKELHLDLGKHPVDGYFKLNGFDTSIIDAGIKAEIDLAVLEKIYPVEGLSVNGMFNIDLKTKGVVNLFFNSFSDISKIKIPPFQMNINVNDASIKYSHLPETIDNINIHIFAENKDGMLSNTIINIDTINMRLGNNSIHGYIHIQNFIDPEIDAEFFADVNLADLEKIYPIEGVEVKGLFILNCKVAGKYYRSLKQLPLIDVKILLKNGYFRSDNFPAPVENIYLGVSISNETGDFSDIQVHLDTLTFIIEEEPFLVSGNISNLNDLTYDIRIKGFLDLEKISKIYPVQDLKMKGKVDIDIETIGKMSLIEAKRYDLLESRGKIEVEDVEFLSNDFPVAIKINRAELTFTPLKIILNRFEGYFGKSDINLTGHLYNSTAFLLKPNAILTGDLLLKSDTLDLNEWLKETGIQQTDTAASALSVPVLPMNINFIFSSDIKYIKYDNLIINDLKGEIAIKRGILSLNKTSFSSIGSKFYINGVYDPHDRENPEFDFEIKVENLDINKAYKEFYSIQKGIPAAEHTYGLVSVNYKIKGELSKDMVPLFETIIGNGEITLHQAHVKSMKIFNKISELTRIKKLREPIFKDAIIVSEIKDGIITIQPFVINISEFETNVEGTYDFNGTLDFILKIGLFPINFAKIPIHIKGNYKKPKVHFGPEVNFKPGQWLHPKEKKRKEKS